MLLQQNWGLAWSGLAISIGVVYLVRSIRDTGEESAILPGVILLVTGLTILSQIEGWTNFAMWRIWPIFFGAVGLGFVLLWAFKGEGRWPLVLGGIFLFAFGYGIASPSWYRYLRDVRHIVDYLPLLIALIGAALLLGHWRKRKKIESQPFIPLSNENIEIMQDKKSAFLIILDGYGLRDDTTGNGVKLANTPFLHGLLEKYPWTKLSASGRDVGLPDGQMGNSEVGHLNIGAGRIVFQEITRIDKAIEMGEFFENTPLNDCMKHATGDKRALHLLGLVSDGGVHSSLDHLFALLKLARREGVSRVFIHAFMDGRDTPPQSGIDHIEALQAKIDEIGVGKIATVTGRYWAMDRDKRWERIEKAYRAMVYGEGLRFDSAEEAVNDSYRRDVTDEFIEPSVIFEGDAPVAVMNPGDSMFFFNFRADRAREITRALADPTFAEFEVKPLNPNYTTMTRYHEKFEFPVAFMPHSMENLLADVIADGGMTQFRIAETEKYAHVTYFFNGGEETPVKGETRSMVASPKVATYDLQPEMSAEGVASRAMDALDEDYSFILLNFANPDMVGHTGSLEAVINALEALEPLVEKLVEKSIANGFTTLITADHGNCEQMFDENGGPFTSHTTNLVPFVVITPDGAKVMLRDSGILADIAPTVLKILGLQQPKEMEGKSLLI